MRSNSFRQKLDLDKTKEKALNLLEYRAHSRKELFDKLIRFSDKDTVNEALDFLEENGLIDDQEFAYEYAHDAIEIRYFGNRRIVMDLVIKGIQKDDAEDAVEKASEECDSEEERIEYLLSTKYHGYFDEKNGKSRIVSGLTRMGYRYDMIKTALENNNFDLEDEDYGF